MKKLLLSLCFVFLSTKMLMAVDAVPGVSHQEETDTKIGGFFSLSPYGRFTSIDDGFSIGVDMRFYPSDKFYILLDPTLGATFSGFFTTDIGVGIGGIVYDWNEDEWNNGDLALQGGLTVGYTFYGGEFADDFRLGLNASFVSRFFTHRTVGMFTKIGFRYDFFKTEFGIDFGIGPSF